MLYVFDVTILLLQMMFSNREQILYGILLVLIYTVVLDKILLMGTTQTQVKIISAKYDEISSEIIRTLDRSTTLIHSQTGYMGTEQLMILTVVSNRELPALNQLVMRVDPQAFMIIGRVNEVKGRGFPCRKNTGKKKGGALTRSALPLFPVRTLYNLDAPLFHHSANGFQPGTLYPYGERTHSDTRLPCRPHSHGHISEFLSFSSFHSPTEIEYAYFLCCLSPLQLPPGRFCGSAPASEPPPVCPLPQSRRPS